MGRPPKFTTDQILDAALAVITEHGPEGTTVNRISEILGAPVGSIYHRFSSRDLLLARLWIRTVDRFQKRLLDALKGPSTVDTIVGATLQVVDWCRDNLDEARVLVLYRRRELISRWPDELGEELAGLNKRAEDAIRHHADQLWGESAPDRLPLLVLAVADLPYACLRRYLEDGQGPPPVVVDRIAAMARLAVEG